MRALTKKDSDLVMKSFIIYQGPEFTIEWYYDDRGKSPALEYFDKLSFEQKDKLFNLLRQMGNAGVIKNKTKFRYENDQIYAFKPSPDRFLCFFFKGAKIIVTNAFEKKSDKLPSREKAKALLYREDYINRIKRGIYYD